jgi:hypothetical protein
MLFAVQTIFDEILGKKIKNACMKKYMPVGKCCNKLRMIEIIDYRIKG